MGKKKDSYESRYINAYTRAEKAEEKATNWKIGFWVLLFCTGLTIIVIIGVVNNIDENQFCRDKLEKYFPEYEWSSVWTNGGFGNTANKCIGKYIVDYNETIELRDGLKEDVNIETKQKTYKLINQEDIDYLNSDNITGALWLIWIVIWLLMVIITVAENQ